MGALLERSGEVGEKRRGAAGCVCGDDGGGVEGVGVRGGAQERKREREEKGAREEHFFFLFCAVSVLLGDFVISWNFFGLADLQWVCDM